MNGKQWTRADTETLMNLHASHHDHEIADKTGHDTDTVQRHRSALGLPAYYGSKYGRWEDLPRASLAAIRRAARMAV
jgi:hypothetical protein